MHCTTKIHVRFADIDSMGHVNNATYLSYFEQARIDFFAKMFNQPWDWKKDGLVLARNEVDYAHPIFLDDDITVKTSVEKVGTKSFTMAYEVWKNMDSNPQFCSKGLSVLVAFNHENQTSCPLPEVWKKTLTKILNES